MLGKNKSKQFLKLKYLLLIPVLVSMLVYTSCEKNIEKSAVVAKNEKRFMKLYTKDSNSNDINVKELKIKGYFDAYARGAKPLSGKEISYNDLTEEEKLDFQSFRKPPSGDKKENLEYKIYEMENGRKVLWEDINWQDVKPPSKDYSNAEEVPFASIDQAPVFPGCEEEEDTKACFKNKIKEHVKQNFDITISEGLEIDSEYKRVFVLFKIDENGAVVNVRSRGPHKIIEKEAIRVIKSLPQMKPGEHNGKKVNVKYTLPITFKVD